MFSERSPVAQMMCVVALGTAMGAASPAAPRADAAINQVQRYCTSSWSRAGIDRQDWQDCTQEAIMHLLSRVPAERLPVVFREPDSQERRELHRAIWRTAQRWRRTPRLQALEDDKLAKTTPSASRDDRVVALETALGTLTPRQRNILTLWSQGHPVREIAARLRIPAARVSDEKYKALEKLREELG